MNLAGKSLLVVDDHDPTRNLLVNFLEGLGATVANASGGIDALKQMGDARFDLVLLDLRMDDMDGLAVLKKAKSEDLAKNYIMMSAEGTVPAAVEAIRLGASDFLVKPFDLNELMSVVTRVLRIQGNGDPSLDPRAQWRDKFAPGLIGEHESLLEVFLVLERIANTDCTVLVLGESGTGKNSSPTPSTTAQDARSGHLCRSTAARSRRHSSRANCLGTPRGHFRGPRNLAMAASPLPIRAPCS